MSFNESYDVADGRIGCHAGGPQTPDTPAVLLLQEIFGVNANIRRTVERLAGEGFRAVAPDIYWRQASGIDLDPDAPDARERAMALAGSYQQTLDQGMDDLRRIVEALRSKHRRVGVLGYCLGGKLAFLGWLRLDVDAAVSYYGVGMAAFLGEVRQQQTPLLMHLGQDDPLNPPPVVAQIGAALAPHSNVEVISHAGVGHAFARLGASSYVADAAQRADAATLAFLRRHLQA